VSAPAACSQDSSGAEAASSTEGAAGVLPPSAAAAAALSVRTPLRRHAPAALPPTRLAAAPAPPSGAARHVPQVGSALAPPLLRRCSARETKRVAARCIATPSQLSTRTRRDADALPAAADGPHGARSAM
jgi:hypothetical protein